MDKNQELEVGEILRERSRKRNIFLKALRKLKAGFKKKEEALRKRHGVDDKIFYNGKFYCTRKELLRASLNGGLRSNEFHNVLWKRKIRIWLMHNRGMSFREIGINMELSPGRCARLCEDGHRKLFGWGNRQPNKYKRIMLKATSNLILNQLVGNV